MNQMTKRIKPGEVNLDLIPFDWPLTPVGMNKNPYIGGWQAKPFTIDQVKKELDSGKAGGVGLISGPVYNKPYGLVWVDIDGPTVYEVIRQESGLTVDQALPRTLTICSGREGRERKLYLVPQKSWPQFARNKYNWHGEGDGEKLEVLWKRHQGVLMGFHPDTDGYYTKDGEDYSFVHNLPVIPDWILNAIAKKNKAQGKIALSNSRIFGETFAINTQIGHDRQIKEAIRALWTLKPEDAEDYEKWLTAGQALHSIDDSLLEEWDKWSQIGSNYRPGECQRKWRSFTKGAGITAGTLFARAQENGFKFSQEHTTMAAPHDVIDNVQRLIDELYQANEMESESEELKTLPDAVKTEFKRPSDKRSGKKLKTVNKNAPQNEIRDRLIVLFHKDFVFDESDNKFYKYEHNQPGMWAPLRENEMKHYISAELDQMTNESLLPQGYALDLIDTMYKTLKSKLVFTEEWNQDKNLLLFENGVYDLDNTELGGFKRGYYINRTLPYSFDPSADGTPIIEWLHYIQSNDHHRVQLLRAWMRAVLVGNTGIQKFLEIIGPGGSGKTSFTSLCHALVGWDGAAVSSLERIEKNRFEMAKLFNKRLCLFNDVSRYGSTVDSLKQLTGADIVNNEHKYKQEETNFRFTGLVMVTANEQVQMQDPTSGLARRRITIPFDVVFNGPVDQMCTLIQCSPGRIEGKFAPDLPGLVNWLLKMPEQEMREYLLATNKKVEYMRTFNIKQMKCANPIAAWMDDCVIFDPGVKTYVGSGKPAPKDADRKYASAHHRLYASYLEFCNDNNYGQFRRDRFVDAVNDIFKNQLKLNVTMSPTRITYFNNITLRDRPDSNGIVDESKQHHYPSVLELAADPDKYREFYSSFPITRQQDYS